MDDDIYQNVETSCPSTREDPSTAQLSVCQQKGRSPSRAAVVCLGLLCVLLLAGITGLGLHYQGFRGQYRTGMTERDQLEIERDQLETSCNNLSAERDNLETRYKTMTAERDNIETRYKTLTAERDKLERERDQLQRESDQSNARIREKPCFQGWTKSGCSWYYLSTENRTWEESRQDCLNRGADLVVISSREEQTFIYELIISTSSYDIWIGLTDRAREGIWTWVDGTPLTTAYWASGQPNSYKGSDQDCVKFLRKNSGQLGYWNDRGCSEINQWIYEK